MLWYEFGLFSTILNSSPEPSTSKTKIELLLRSYPFIFQSGLRCAKIMYLIVSFKNAFTLIRSVKCWRPSEEAHFQGVSLPGSQTGSESSDQLCCLANKYHSLGFSSHCTSRLISWEDEHLSRERLGRCNLACRSAIPRSSPVFCCHRVFSTLSRSRAGYRWNNQPYKRVHEKRPCPHGTELRGSALNIR